MFGGHQRTARVCQVTWTNGKWRCADRDQTGSPGTRRNRRAQDSGAAAGVRYSHALLALSGVDFISAAGKMTMQVILAVAEFEKDQLIERTHSGLARARVASKRFGQPPTLNLEQRQAALSA